MAGPFLTRPVPLQMSGGIPWHHEGPAGYASSRYPSMYSTKNHFALPLNRSHLEHNGCCGCKLPDQTSESEVCFKYLR